MIKIKTKFTGDDEYLQSEDEVDLSLVKGNPNLKLLLPEEDFDDNDVINIPISSNLEQYCPVDFYQDARKIGTLIIDENGEAVAENVTMHHGFNLFTIVSPETPLFVSSEDEDFTDTTKRRTKISLELLDSGEEYSNAMQINHDLKVRITLKQIKNNVLLQNKPLTVVIGDNEYNVTTNSNGVAEVNHRFGATGEHQISVSFNGDSANYLSSFSTKVNVKKLVPTVQILSRSTIYKGWYIRAKIVDDRGVPIPNATVQFKINTVYYPRTTDSDGNVKLHIKLRTGSYNYQINVQNSDITEFKSFSSTVTVRESLVVELSPSGAGSIYHQKQSDSQLDWNGNYLGPSNKPLGENVDEYFVRCGVSCQNPISPGKQPSILCAAAFNLGGLPYDLSYIEKIEAVYITRYVGCNGRYPNVGPGTVILEDYNCVGGAIHIEKKGRINPGTPESSHNNGWNQNVIEISGDEFPTSYSSFKLNKILFGLHFDANSGNKGLLDVGWMSLKVYYSPAEVY